MKGVYKYGAVAYDGTTTSTKGTTMNELEIIANRSARIAARRAIAASGLEANETRGILQSVFVVKGTNVELDALESILR